MAATPASTSGLGRGSLRHTWLRQRDLALPA